MNKSSIPAGPASAGVPTAQFIVDLTQTDLAPGTPVYIYVIGLVSYTNSKGVNVNDFYRLDQDFMPQLMHKKDNTQPQFSFPGEKQLSPDARDAIKINYPLAWADYSIPVTVGDTSVMCLGNISTANIPGLGTGTSAFSGRIYVSAGIPRLPFTVQDSGYTAPVFGNGSGVGGSLCLYDWIEFSYDSLGNFNGNTTQVNQFGIPLMLTGTTTGRTTYPTQGKLNMARETILSDIAGTSAAGGAPAMVAVPAGGGEAYPAGIDYLRAVAPVTLNGGTENALSTYYDTVISTAYEAWQATPLVTTDPATGTYSCVVFPITASGVSIQQPANYTPGSLACYSGNYATMAALQAAIAANPGMEPDFCLTGALPAITSDDIWQCAGSIASGSDAQKNVGKMIGAAFNRGMILDPATHSVITTLNDSTCAGNAGSFYPSGGTYNGWAQAFHSYNSNGLAYGFPYDDVCEQNPSIPPQGETLAAGFITVAIGTFYNKTKSPQQQQQQQALEQ